MQNSFLMTHPFSLLLKMKMKVQMSSIMTYFFLLTWKMLFNPDPNKPAQEVLFSKKKKQKVIRQLALTIFKFKDHLIKNI